MWSPRGRLSAHLSLALVLTPASMMTPLQATAQVPPNGACTIDITAKKGQCGKDEYCNGPRFGQTDVASSGDHLVFMSDGARLRLPPPVALLPDNIPILPCEKKSMKALCDLTDKRQREVKAVLVRVDPDSGFPIETALCPVNNVDEMCKPQNSGLLRYRALCTFDEIVFGGSLEDGELFGSLLSFLTSTSRCTSTIQGTAYVNSTCLVRR